MNKPFLVFLFIGYFALLAGCSGSKEASTKKVLEEAKYNTKLPDSLLKKQTAGIDYYATGNQPSAWVLEMDYDQGFVFKANDGNNLSVMPTKSQTTAEGGMSFRSGEMFIEVTGAPGDCMNARGKDAKQVAVTVKGTRYTGCGDYLFDYRVGESWVLEKINNNPVNAAMFTRGLPNLQLNVDNHTVKGHDGCNTLSGTIALMGSKMKFSPLATTRMACPNDIFGKIVAQQFSDKVVDYYIRDGKLVFYLPDDSMLTFRKD